jgi:hypothetical protein
MIGVDMALTMTHIVLMLEIVSETRLLLLGKTFSQHPQPVPMDTTHGQTSTSLKELRESSTLLPSTPSYPAVKHLMLQ